MKWGEDGGMKRPPRVGGLRPVKQVDLRTGGGVSFIICYHSSMLLKSRIFIVVDLDEVDGKCSPAARRQPFCIGRTDCESHTRTRATATACLAVGHQLKRVFVILTLV